MLRLSTGQLDAMARGRETVQAEEIAARLNREGYRVSEDTIRKRIAEAKGYGLRRNNEVRIYADRYTRIEAKGYEMSRIRRLMSNADLSIDHRLIPMSLLLEILERTLERKKAG